METMKKQWGKPLTNVQQFVPQEFIAACDPDEEYVTYQFWCDAAISGWFGDYTHHVYFDNGDGVFNSRTDRSALPSGWHYDPCGEAHDVTVRKGESIDNVFPKGWLVPLNGITGAELTDRARAIRIWQPNPTDYENTHCTFQLTENEFSIKNPS